MIQAFSYLDKFYVAVSEVAPTVAFLGEMRLKGKVDYATFRKAFFLAIEKFPILRCRAVKKSLWRDGNWMLFWKEDHGDVSGILDYLDLRSPAGAAASAKSIEQRFDEEYLRWSNMPFRGLGELPVKARLIRVSEDETTFFLLLQHAVTDGVGFLTFLSQLIEIYNDLVRGRRPRLDVPRPAPRSYRKFLRGLGLKGWAALIATYFRYQRFNRPRRVITRIAAEVPDRPGRIKCIRTQLAADPSARLRGKAKELGLSVNELLLTASAKRVERWNRDRGAPTQKIVIAVPVNLRPYVGLSPLASIANATATMNIIVNEKHLRTLPALMSAVSTQSRWIKKYRLAAMNVVENAFFAWMPLGSLKRMIRRMYDRGVAHKNTPTLTLSNVGPVWTNEKGETVVTHLGEAEILYMSASNPTVYPAFATLWSFQYKGEMHIGFSYLDPPLSDSDAGLFLRGLTQELEDALAYEAGADDWEGASRKDRPAVPPGEKARPAEDSLAVTGRVE